jgi:hypothetical protein
MTDFAERGKPRIEDADAIMARELEQLETECTMRMTKIRQNSHMKDVVQLKDVAIADVLRPRLHEIRALHQLTVASETRLRELLDGHILELRRAHSVSALEQLRSHFLHREWNVLKGTYPELHREAEREAEKLLLRLEYETDVRRKRGR